MLFQIFGANFSYSWGPVAWLACAEIFSPGHRSQAVSIIISCNYMMNVSSHYSRVWKVSHCSNTIIVCRGAGYTKHVR